METIKAETPSHQRAWINKQAVRQLLKKSPRIEGLYSVEIVELRIVYYQKNKQLQALRFRQLKKQYPGMTIIVKQKKYSQRAEY